MMDHSTYRRSVLADPKDPSPLLREHRDACPECDQYTERLLQFDARLERALRVGLPASALGPARRRPERRSWLAMAASLLVACVVGGSLWLAAPGPSLAADVVTHMAGEPGAWRRTDQAVPDAELEQVLRDSHLRLASGAGLVSYASSCLFRGHRVPHLVIQTPSGPVTVMVLVHEDTAKPVQFEDAGYRGVIVPVPGHGSLAVLSQDSSMELSAVERIAAQVLDAIVWTA
jgi:hypothetical protein